MQKCKKLTKKDCNHILKARQKYKNWKWKEKKDIVIEVLIKFYNEKYKQCFYCNQKKEGTIKQQTP